MIINLVSKYKNFLWSREWVEIILAIPKNRRVLQNQLPKDNLFRGTKGKIVHPEVKKKQEVVRKKLSCLMIIHWTSAYKEDT